MSTEHGSRAACALIVALAKTVSVRNLSLVEPTQPLPSPTPGFAAYAATHVASLIIPFILLFRVSAATLWTVALICAYRDPSKATITHRERKVDVRHLGRFVTFTLWCNCLLCAYWWSSSAAVALEWLGMGVPTRLHACTQALWAVCFPLSWLVAIVVSYVLIPAGRTTQPEWVRVCLQWRALVFHNGAVLACTIDCALARPPMAWTSWPLVLLFGTTYIVFSWLLYQRLGVYCYFFLDPYYRWAPLAYLGLLGLTCGCSMACVALTAWLERASWPLACNAAVLAAALATCTWR